MSRIKVVFLASSFVGRTASGTAEYAKKIVEGLSKDPGRFQVFIFCNDKSQVELLTNQNYAAVIHVMLLPQVKGKWLKSSRQYFKYCFQSQHQNELFDVVHFSNPRLYPFFWFFPSRKFVSTFHAAGDITAQRDKFVLSRWIYNLIAKTSWRHLDGIIAVSKQGKFEIEKHYRIPSSKITIIPPGVDQLWNVIPRKPPIRLSNGYVLIMGRWQSFKNVDYALDEAINFCGFTPSPIEIVVLASGPKGNFMDQERLDGLHRQGVHFLDFVPEEEMLWLIRNSKAVIFPSLNEGFGIPAFQAFGEGKPTFVHQETPITRILGEVKNLIPVDMKQKDRLVLALRSALAQASDGETLASREKLQARSLTWDQTLEGVRSLYETISEP